MDNYQLISDVAGLLQRVQELENKIEDLEDFELPGLFGCDQGTNSVTMIAEEVTVADQQVRKLTFTWGGDWWCQAMEHKSSKLVMYSNGTFDTATVLRNHSRHRKYGNRMTFRLKFADSGNVVCNISSFSGNFSNGEEKPYPTSGQDNDCVRNNFDLVAKGELIPNINWSCWKRN